MHALVNNVRSMLGDDDNKVGLLEPQTILEGTNNGLVSEIAFEIGQADMKTAYISLTDNKVKRYSPPEDLVAKKTASETMRLDMCGLEYSTDDTFSFKFSSTRDGSTLVSSEGGNFLMLEKYIQLDLHLPSQRIYGLGERQREFNLEQGTWTMWANGQETPYDDGKGGKQTYGVHPFALVQTQDPKEFMGIYFRNTNAQSPVLVFNDDGSSTLSYITTGGSLDIYFFFKGTAKQIISQYQNMVGLPALPPFWALGWHASSKKYSNMTNFQENIQGYADAKIPLEGVWLDNSYMENYTDFSVNNTAFPGLVNYTNELKKQNKRMIVVVDAGLSADDVDNKYFKKALTKNALIMSSINDSEESFEGVLVSHVYSNKTVFLDFFSDDSADIWNLGLKNLHKKLPYDGLQLDMNEATSFCNGECPKWMGPLNETESTKRRLSEELSNVNPNLDSHKTKGQSVSSVSAAKFMVIDDDENQGFTDHSWYMSAKSENDSSTYYLPFIPGRVNLDNMAMSLNATHPSNNMSEYDVHNLFGHLQAKRTMDFFLNESMSANPKNRTFTLSRSTFAGSGQYTQHWLGNSKRTWDDMRLSIAGVMNFNMFGIPMVGPDTCGTFSAQSDFAEDQEICTYWIQLATFYPFARQNMGDGYELEPWRLPESLQTKARDAINDRYQYIRHMYTCLFEASKQGRSCFDPLLFHFPEDPEVYKNIENTFLVGDSLKVSPFLGLNHTNLNDTFSSYFPAAGGDWVSMQNYSDILKLDDPTKGQYFNLNSNVPTINVHLRPGHIVPKQSNIHGFFNSSEEMLTMSPLSLIINRDDQGHAAGNLFIDDGYTRAQFEDESYEHYTFDLGGKTLKKQINNPQTAVDNQWKLNDIVITNAEDLKDTNFACHTSMTDRTITPLITQYDEVQKTLKFTGFIKQGPLNLYDLRDVHFGTSATDLNLCNPERHYYRFDNKTSTNINFDNNKTSVILTSQTPHIMRDLNLTLSLLVSGVINIHWTYANMTGVDKIPFEVPETIIDHEKEILCQTLNLSSFVVASEGPQGAAMLNISNGAGIVVFSLNGMILSEYMNYIDLKVYTDRTFKTGVLGLTERLTNDLFLDDGVYSLWARDTQDLDSGHPGNNLYGTHPFFMGRSPNDDRGRASTGWFGVFANNAAAQDWWIKNNHDNGAVDVKTIATGGVGDLYIMFHRTPDGVNKMYHSIVGTPVLTPQWALGWHQSRVGYNSTELLKEVVANYSAAGIPLDTQWSAFDYMKDYRDFTYDKESSSFSELGQFVDDIHAKDMHYIPIIGPGIAVRANKQQDGETYEVYEDGMKEDIFIKNQAGEVLVGQQWAGDTAFPDFFNSKTSGWWSKWLSNFHDKIKFDGLWEDENEVTNYCSGDCYASQKSSKPVKNRLPYAPTQKDLEDKALSLDAVHADNEEMGTKDVTELEAHSLFGTMQAQATHEWFKKQGKRTMIIERSSYAGIGKFASRWLGDNFSQEKYMGYSFTGIMAQNIMGIQLVGSNICGAIGDTTAELCARWHIVGSFYPFSRNHNTQYAIDQEPYRFIDFYDNGIQYIDIMRMAIYNKYNLLRYYYTEMSFKSEEGGSFIKPLFFEFPEDNNTVWDQENNVMIGSALKLAVLTNQIGQNTTDFYFPAGNWCNIIDESDSCRILETGKNFTLSSKAYNFHLHIRQGYIVPMQDAKALGIKTSADLQKHPVDFHILPSENGTHYFASGRYLNDDGTVLDPTGYQNRYQIEYASKKNSMGGIQHTLSFNRTANASSLPDTRVNMNDALNMVKFHNAGGAMFSKNLNVTANFVNGTKAHVGDGIFNKDLDTLVFKVAKPESEPLYLTDLESLYLAGSISS